MVKFMKDKFHIRSGDAADLEVALDLLNRFYLEEGLPTTVGEMTPPLTLLLQGGCGIVLFACREDRPIGIAVTATSIGVEQGGRIGDLTDLFVLPGWRGRGVAASLISATAAWAKEQGCTFLQLVVTPEGEANHQLTGFYRKQSFVETGRRLLFRRL
jgi:aminoglycoside 6'-N-acetyltransferase I